MTIKEAATKIDLSVRQKRYLCDIEWWLEEYPPRDLDAIVELAKQYPWLIIYGIQLGIMPDEVLELHHYAEKMPGFMISGYMYERMIANRKP